MLASLSAVSDTLFALDAARRLTAFDSNDHATSYAILPPTTGSLPLNPRALSGSAIILSQTAAPGHPLLEARGQLFVRAHADGRMIDTLGSLDVRDQMMRIPLVEGQSEVQVVQPYVEVDRITVSGSGRWIAIVRAPSSLYNDDARANAVEIISPQGRTTLQVPVHAQPLTDATVRQWLDQQARDLGGHIPGGQGAARRAIASRLVRPKLHPAVRAATIGDDGVLWLLQSPVDAPIDRWTLLASTGDVVGAVELPRGSRPIVVSRSEAWVVQERDDGEQELVRYRVRH